MSWLESALMYQIFIDRFAGYDPAKDWRVPDFMGGNLRGIIDKFDYIESLGVNALWLSPFYKGTQFHGYEITDFMSVDERFGTEADLKELIDLAHSRGMKIIADSVPNHVASQHPYFIDAQTNPESPYRDWFIFRKWPNNYVCYQFFDTLPKLNLNNPDALAYMQASARKWLELGLDGYRIDHIIGLSNKNVSDLFSPLKHEFPDAVFFGEAAMFGADGDPASSRSSFSGLSTVRIPRRYIGWALKQRGLNMIMRNYMGMLDGMLDFYFAYQMVQYAKTNNPRRREQIAVSLKRRAQKFPADFSLVYFLDNHDLTRYLFRTNGDIATLLSAIEVMLSLRGAKVIYNGTEVGVSQEKSFRETKEHPDIQARKPMPWNEVDQNTALLAEFKKLVENSKAE